MAIVYRYENSAGHGPWTAHIFDSGPKLFHKEATLRHPTPSWQMFSHLNLYADDPPEKIKKHKIKWVCCWLTYSQLRRWFTPMERKLLKQHGFNLRRYKVPNRYVLGDERQGIFHKEFAELVA